MKKIRFTGEKIVTILREADMAPVAEVAKKHGISEQTIYNCLQHFGGLEAADVKRDYVAFMPKSRPRPRLHAISPLPLSTTTRSILTAR